MVKYNFILVIGWDREGINLTALKRRGYKL